MISYFLNKSGTVRVVIVDSSNISNYLLNIHKFSYPVSRIMSKFVTGSVILSSTLKGNDVLGCYINCEGPATGLRVEVNTLGQIKGYSLNPQAGLDDTDKTYALTDDQLFLNGKLTVTKILEGGKHPFTGSIQFDGGDIAKIFSHYLFISEQVKSGILISNVVEKTGLIEKSSGLLVQAMPGATDEDLKLIELKLKSIKHFSEIIIKSDNNRDILNKVFKNHDFSLISEKQLEFKCSCSKFKVVSVLKSFKKKDLDSVKTEYGNYSVKCDYCNTEYIVEDNELFEILN